MAEMAGVVETYKRHIKAKQEAAQQQLQAASSGSTGPPDQDAPPGSHRVIPEDAPWQISSGTKAHARLLAGSSVGTQRFALEYFQRRGKGKGKGKNKGNPTAPTDHGELGPTPAEARAYFQAREATPKAAHPTRTGGTPARPPSDALGGLRPGSEGGFRPEGGRTGGDVMEVDTQLAGQRRKRDEEEDGERLPAAHEGTRTPRSFPEGDDGGSAGIPPGPTQ